MHAVAAFFASIIAVISSVFASPTVAPNAPVNIRAAHAAAAAATQIASSSNPFFDPSAPPVTPADPTPAFSPPQQQTVINQPVVERIIERVVPQGNAGISADKLSAILTDFGQSIENRIAAVASAPIVFSGPAPTTPVSTASFAPSQRIDQLTNTPINTPTITGGAISGASSVGASSGSFDTLSAGTLALSGALTGTDASFSGTLSAGTLNVTGLSSQGALTGPYFTATSTTATSSFAGGLTAANGGFSILQNGNVGIGTTSPTSKLYIEGGTAGNNNLPIATITGGGDSPTSVQLLLRNTREGAGAGGQDYENEVHLRLQAGTTNEHRAYINFANKDGVDQWLTGKNASNVWILYNSTDGHRLWMESTAGVAPLNTGNTYLNSSGSGSVQINNGNNDGDTFGTGGFEVFGGGTYPRTSLFKVSSLTATDAVLKATNNGSGYAPASLLLTATNANTRGQGIFHYNTVSDTSWFTGVPYNVAGAKWMVGYESNATWDPAVAQTSKALFTIQNNGNIGIGTTTPWGKLSVQATDNSSVPQLVIASSTATSLFVGANGKVGIGTTTPAKLLDIYGTAAGLSIDASSGNPSVAFKRNSATDATIATAQAAGQVVTGSATGDLAIRSESHSILFSTNSGTTAHMAIDTGGNVGIGTTTPATKLEVAGSASTLATLRSTNSASLINFFDSGSSGSAESIGTNGNNSLQLITDGSARITVDSAGSVGIGTTTPWGKLSVTGSGTGTGLAFAVADSANTPRFVIQDNGNVGIATTTGLVAKLHVNGNIFAGAGSAISNYASSVGITDWTAIVGTSTTSIPGIVLGEFDGSTNKRATIYYDIPNSRVVFNNTYGSGGFADYLFKTASADLLTIKSTGNIGIGTTTPQAKLSVSNTTGGSALDLDFSNNVFGSGPIKIPNSGRS
jgi:hypothetical protein